MKRKLAMLLAGVMLVGSILSGCGGSEEPAGTTTADGELEGDITFWHSFTQGPRLETIQKVADQFMEDNPKVNITIETFSWADFYAGYEHSVTKSGCGNAGCRSTDSAG